MNNKDNVISFNENYINSNNNEKLRLIEREEENFKTHSYNRANTPTIQSSVHNISETNSHHQQQQSNSDFVHKFESNPPILPDSSSNNPNFQHYAQQREQELRARDTNLANKSPNM